MYLYQLYIYMMRTIPSIIVFILCKNNSILSVNNIFINKYIYIALNIYLYAIMCNHNIHRSAVTLNAKGYRVKINSVKNIYIHIYINIYIYILPRQTSQNFSTLNHFAELFCRELLLLTH